MPLKHSMLLCIKNALKTKTLFPVSKLVKDQIREYSSNRFVHTTQQSSLTAAFNTKPRQKLSFNLRKDDAGLFGIPELRNHNGFYLLKENVENSINELVNEALSPNRKRKMVEIFDSLSDSLCRVADMSEFIRLAHPNEAYTKSAEDCCIALSGLVECLNTNVELYQALKKVLETGDIIPMDCVDERVGKLFLFDFEQSGIHLDEVKRKHFVQLNESILMLGTYFSQGCQKPSSILKSQLPDKLQHCFSVSGDNVTVGGLFSDHYSDLVREAAYKIFLQNNKHQNELLDALLNARYALAQLVGFPTYAHRSLRGTLADNPVNVMNFLETLAKEVSKKADEDYSAILKLKMQYSSNPQSCTVKPWDPPYYTALSRQERCNVNNTELFAYFSLGCCMEGLNNLFKCLYDVHLQPVEVEHGEVWSYDVCKLAVVHGTEGVLGYIYCDFYERIGKPIQDCHFTIQGGRLKEDGIYQLPIVVLQLNFPPPQTSVPSLLSPGMMENLFHEFGHAMHSMLGRTKYQHVTGTRCSTDFAEVPSVLMEYFASDPRVLSTFARHYKTGEPLKMEIIHNLCAAKKLFAASDLQLQVFYSILDQVYHGKLPAETSTIEILGALQNKYYGIAHVPGTAWQLRFVHLVGYGARYYSYLLSRAVASRIWEKCFKEDPFSQTMGERYRRELLSHGGGRPPQELIEGLLGEQPTMDKLVSSLINELEQEEV
ncbi:mitochondrial intermediate peptidase [Octopus sinensis]|uniref:Mitochondrial intermediate peptidase n=1 Tax=Octopus sinensis TaxID=2607531 RepID=A0A6P7S7G6_9MOLL|nr:mitochondrial intermediate peptidase [Octopus sinensis]